MGKITKQNLNSKLFFALTVWGIALIWGYYFGDKVPKSWGYFFSEYTWVLLGKLPLASPDKVGINLRFAFWVNHRLFFLFYFLINVIVLALVVPNRLFVKRYIKVMVVLYVVHSLLDTFGWFEVEQLSWRSYWVYKLFSFFATPLICLLGIILYKVEQKL